MRRTGLHFGETLIGRNGVDLHPTFPRLFLPTRWLKGQSGQETQEKIVRNEGKTKEFTETVWSTGRKEVNNENIMEIK